MVLALCTSSNADIYMKFCEDSLNGFQVIEQTQEWQTDRQTDALVKNNMSPNPKGGRHNEIMCLWLTLYMYATINSKMQILYK